MLFVVSSTSVNAFHLWRVIFYNSWNIQYSNFTYHPNNYLDTIIQTIYLPRLIGTCQWPTHWHLSCSIYQHNNWSYNAELRKTLASWVYCIYPTILKGKIIRWPNKADSKQRCKMLIYSHIIHCSLDLPLRTIQTSRMSLVVFWYRSTCMSSTVPLVHTCENECFGLWLGLLCNSGLNLERPS